MPPLERSAFDRAVDAIEAELALISGDARRVADSCSDLRRLAAAWASPECASRLVALAARSTIGSSDAHAPLLDLLHDAIEQSADPWPLLAPLLAASDRVRLDRALDHLARLAEGGRLPVDDDLIASIAALVESTSALQEPTALARIHAVAARGHTRDPDGVASDVYAHGTDIASRRLAARLLDLPGTLPSQKRTLLLLGRKVADLLAPYLAYTRATHLDVLDLAIGLAAEPSPGALLASLQRAERACGAALFGALAGELGWAALNAGLEVTRCAGVSVGGSFPLLLSPAEAALVTACDGARAVFDRLVVVAHGVSAGGSLGRHPLADAVARFRASNLRHAEMLPAFLDIAPLTHERVRALLGQMDCAVEDFRALFAAVQAEECAAIASACAELKAKIERERASSAPGRPLGPAATRLVQMFEDPASPAEIRTLHGCKRYLHQRGLRLGFGLVERAPGTNRTATIAVASADHVLQVHPPIEYVDFEPRADRPVPSVVRAACAALARHAVRGARGFPRLRIFCYGNEVHCFVAFRNHPAFIRIDTSPPQRGGMIDLEYCGVSKYELEYHPNVALTAIDRVFRRVDFDVHVKDTRIHARYDKERAGDARDLGEKIDSLFHLVPSLMDVDWVIGDLKLSDAARAAVATAWAEFFVEWRVLPIPYALTADRVGILLGLEPGPAGDRELRWSGDGPYRDVFTVDPPPGFWRGLGAAASALAREPLPCPAADDPVTERRLDRHVLAPLRRMVARGELVESAGGYAPAPADFFRRRHEAAVLANVLMSDDESVAASAQLASLAAVLEPALRFETTGAVNGYAVERAAVPLPDEALTLFVLRDGAGIPRLAIAGGDVLCETRPDAASAWRRHWSADSADLATALRRGNFTVAWLEPAREDARATATAARRPFSMPNERRDSAFGAGEPILRGVKASPGRAVGPARLGVSGRRPEDVEGGVLVVPALTPQDQPFVFRSAAVVSTGGGVLSHAGLLALQFHKPALVVAGRWERSDGAAPALAYTSRRGRRITKRIGPYEVTERYETEGEERRIAEGDLLVVDGDAGIVRDLGQECDALALHEELRQLVAACRGLEAATAAEALLALRGRALRSRHQLERLLVRIIDPSLARHVATELLVGEVGRERTVAPAIKALLTRTLLANPIAGGAAREAVQRLHDDEVARAARSEVEALHELPRAKHALDVVALRLEVVRSREQAGDVGALLNACEVIGPPSARSTFGDVDELAAARLTALRARMARWIERSIRRTPHPPRLRHRLRLLARIDAVLATPEGDRLGPRRIAERLEAHDASAVRALAGARVLGPDDGGLELWPLAGSKAANLAEARRLGVGRLVPPWFVVSDRAFRDVLDSGSPPLRESIESVLARADITDAQKAGLVRAAWERATLPEALTVDLAAAYEALRAYAGAAEPFVAVRSSAREEDVEAASRAGEFDTFLFVRGLDSVVAHLKRAWSGLWNERAIHSRAVLGLRGEVGGGVLIQRMADARASGVLHTVNLADGRLDEMVINAGLGLGEGIVSGAVAADLVVVSKRESLASRQLRFRYVTNDKREQVIFDVRFGSGTVRAETLYRQRLRPAIEYVELCDLVKAANRLEWAYGQPLDLEFAFEGAQLRLLQIRPLPAALAIWRATVERYPLAAFPGRAVASPAIAG